MIRSNKLSAKIVEAGYSKTSLAEALGMSKNTLCNKINGKNKFNVDEIMLICEKLKIVSPEEKVDIFLANPSHL